MESSASSVPRFFHTPAPSEESFGIKHTKCYPGQDADQLELSTQPGLKLRQEPHSSWLTEEISSSERTWVRMGRLTSKIFLPQTE